MGIHATQSKSVWPQFQSAAQRTNDGYVVELALPSKMFSSQQDGRWNSFQLAVILNGVDEAGDPPNRVLWRGSDLVDGRNDNFGHFVRNSNK